MKVGVITLMAVLLLALPALAGNVVDPCVASPTDTDGDGWCDLVDNCSEVSNLNQYDADGDGYGNICDADFDNDNVVGGTDFLLFGPAFGVGTIPPTSPIFDLNGDNVVGGADFLLFGPAFGAGAPGPACQPGPGGTKGIPCP